jgi:hypothetical protein
VHNLISTCALITNFIWHTTQLSVRMKGRMNGFHVLAEEYWEGKGESLVDNSALKLLRPTQIPHSRPGIEVRPQPWETANLRLSYDKRNYVVGFTSNVNGHMKFSQNDRLFQRVERGNHSYQERVIRLIEQQSFKTSAVQIY